MPSEYRDHWIECLPDAIRIRGYYFPWGTKRIPYSSIRSVKSVDIGAFTGQGQIWGTANPRYWGEPGPSPAGRRSGSSSISGSSFDPS